MNATGLKHKIIQRITEIEDVELLKSIDNLFNTSDENISKFLANVSEKFQNDDVNETEDFTGYIKEWVKNM
ncbi:MAG: hypothetical protein ACOH1N_01490 [Lutibacter sp.]